MEYTHVDPDDLEPVADRPCDMRRVSEPTGLEHVAINRFRAEPGEQVPLAYHYHETQEEAFFVCSGTLRVETPEGEFTVPEGSLFSARPKAPHRAYNPADAESTVEVIAIGAPPVDGDAVHYDPDE
ncbi:Mannose-6-phosphate isomerase, cupin superfamily [Natronorubrum sediminis]|uniref:Mannose-6-phosphate isomerase, cupin superfamily n=1 Tax=Natronorubrum sediminis TaxID=640943 RepID=A0A1H6FUA4_9EURY|nr:cupin domain-containing protein [Natronorubrum sediminis]SEH13414.1 Mannose-6-phosphate isomerase, cupin superfamily [Natronorubrum sediminis]